LALHYLLAGLILRLLSGFLLLLLGLILLPFTFDISIKCFVVLPSLLKYLLGYNQFLF
jgi:hypothetical protein